jgi:alkylhydroperoxidase/carboxymuconolactone decarboxylase family protein YurZ
LRDQVLKDGAIPAKYKVLMTMIVDAIMNHPEGVSNLANRARSNGATEDEIRESVQVAFLFGGTPALVTAVNAFRKPLDVRLEGLNLTAPISVWNFPPACPDHVELCRQ